MPRGIGWYDLSDYLRSLIGYLRDKNISYDMLDDELKALIDRPDNIQLDQLSEELQQLVLSINEEVTYEDLDAYLQSKIDEIGKITPGEGGDTVYVSNTNIFKGTKEITYDTSKVSFICGFIKEFEPYKDTLNAYLNGVRLLEGKDYKLSEDAKSIICLKEEGWKLSGEEKNIFDFEVHTDSVLEGKNDGFIVNKYIGDGEITYEKLSPELQDMISSGRGHTGAIVSSNLYGYKRVYEATDTVHIICGDIYDFDKNKDSIEVYLNTTRLTRGVHYDLNEEGTAIIAVDGAIWTIADKEEYNLFEFTVQKNAKIDNMCPTLFGYKYVEDQVHEVNFICGEIDRFNIGTDTIEVYLNSTRLTRGVHYEVEDDYIVNLNGDWKIGKDEGPNLFEFVVQQNSRFNMINSVINIKSGFATIIDNTIDRISYLMGDIDNISPEDKVRVYVNTTRLVPNSDFIVDLNKQMIVFTDAKKGTEENPLVIEVEVFGVPKSNTDESGVHMRLDALEDEMRRLLHDLEWKLR